MKIGKCGWLLIIGIVGFVLVFGANRYLGEGDDDYFNDFDWEEARARSEYKESTMRLYNESGTPQQYTCEQIKVMYISDSYPERSSMYECKSSPDEEYTWCKTSTTTNTKDMFVKYYILNCLEQKYASGEKGK